MSHITVKFIDDVVSLKWFVTISSSLEVVLEVVFVTGDVRIVC